MLNYTDGHEESLGIAVYERYDALLMNVKDYGISSCDKHRNTFQV